MRYGKLSGPLLALALSGCGGGLPGVGTGVGSTSTPLEAPPAATAGTGAAPKPGAVGATLPAEPVSTTSRIVPPVAGDQIIGFAKSTVVLYRNPTGHDGERVTATSLSTPMRIRHDAALPTRVEIMTTAGPRWLDKSEVKLGAIATPGVASGP